LWLLEALDDLEEAETAEHAQDGPGVRRGRQSGAPAEPEEPFRTLTYEEFVRGRRLRSDLHTGNRNSLAGSDVSLVRDFLNRVLSIGNEMSPGQEERSVAGLDLADETADPEGAIEGGENFPTTAPRSPAKTDANRQQAVQARATCRQVADAVEELHGQIGERVARGGISVREVLRLRVMLMIIVAAGQSVVGKARSPLQVLPCNLDEEGWPKLIGRVLFSFFGGTHPAIRELSLSTIFDEVPDDILECWATAFWCCQACLVAAAQKNLKQQFRSILTGLTDRVYGLTGLRSEELNNPRIATVLDSLNARFAERLGVQPEEIRAHHIATVRRVRPPMAAQ
jgi:hypothetical protein